jgi:hypothetical protein
MYLIAPYQSLQDESHEKFMMEVGADGILLKDDPDLARKLYEIISLLAFRTPLFEQNKESKESNESNESN